MDIFIILSMVWWFNSIFKFYYCGYGCEYFCLCFLWDGVGKIYEKKAL